MRARLALSAAALLMALAVALGAFGAHALKARFAPDALALWKTAVDYHAWHAIGMFGAGLLMLQLPRAAALRHATWLFALGIVLFSGSLYALALGMPGAFAIATPFGGAAFVAGWIALALGVLRRSAADDAQ